MNEKQIVTEIIKYLEDSIYNYAVMINGEWGTGKTYFATGELTRTIEEYERKKPKARKVEYVTLYGCKSAEDVSVKFTWAIINGFYVKGHTTDRSSFLQKLFLRKGNRIGGILKRAINETTQKLVLNKVIFDIVSGIIPLKDYIFIVDDLERCDCNINELFGFLNILVEHKEAKVIILANETEISDHIGDYINRDFQYYIALQNSIEWPNNETLMFSLRSLDEVRNIDSKISIEELDRRHRLLSLISRNNREYFSIKEKLVGITLDYEPSYTEIVKEM